MTMTAAVEGSVITLAVLVAVIGVLCAYAVRVMLVGRVVSARLDGERGTPLLGRYPIEAFHWAVRAVGRTLVRTGVSPDMLTILSLMLAAGTIPLAATGHFEAAGVTFLFGSVLDALDGVVAREREMASDAGEMLDAVVDRYADAFPLIGLAVFYRHETWQLGIVLVTLLGSMMVSYVRAKAETFGLKLPAGLMRRPERIAYLCAALLVGPLLSSWLVPKETSRPITLGLLALVGVVSNFAALRLLWEARSELRRRDSSGEP
jgi:CDP-diacylglycerol---glycerol-3-phosphate 3-phosphatidyltransferase